MMNTIQNQLQHLDCVEIPALVEMLPSDAWYKSGFHLEDDMWRFQFVCNHLMGSFHASGMGQTPAEAFLIAKQVILQQIDQWHKTRFMNSHMLPPPLNVLIVDDDVDLALAMQTALSKLGHHVDVANKHENLHHTIAEGNADYILLDWKLNNDVNAGQVMEKTGMLIDTFSDLRHKFELQKPRIVTYSSLDCTQTLLPAAGSRYFRHVDHWQKPMPFQEALERASELLTMR